MSALYSEKIMDHYKNPRNRGIMEDATVSMDATNPVCGDCTNIQLKIKDDVIEDIKFESMGCAVSVASASIMTDYVKGKNIEEAKKLTKAELLDMLEAQLTPAKLDCATMSVDALGRAIKSYEQKKQ